MEYEKCYIWNLAALAELSEKLVKTLPIQAKKDYLT
jgi:hypothetical protein